MLTYLLYLLYLFTLLTLLTLLTYPTENEKLAQVGPLASRENEQRATEQPSNEPPVACRQSQIGDRRSAVGGRQSAVGIPLCLLTYLLTLLYLLYFTLLYFTYFTYLLGGFSKFVGSTFP